MINSTNSEYVISHESELAYVLSKFNNDFIYITVTESINTRLRNYGNSPNIVNALATNFELIKNEFPGNEGEIIDTRNEVYANIIRILCDYYQLEFDDHDSNDLLLSASLLYSFLVSDFQSNIIKFFVNFILKEKNEIYNASRLSERKRNKDAATLYAKKIIKDQKLSIICANLELVVDNICKGFDITLDTYISMVALDNRDYYNFLITSIKPVNDFFKTYIAPVFIGEFRPILLTSIRLQLQQVLISEAGINIDIINGG